MSRREKGRVSRWEKGRVSRWEKGMVSRWENGRLYTGIRKDVYVAERMGV